MWSNIKKLISNKISQEEILKRTYLKLEQEEEHLYHLQMSLQGQQKKLSEKVHNLQKHIRKNDFDIKAAIDNENKTKAFELNNYGNTLKKERDHFLQSGSSLEQKHLDASCELSKIHIQKEKISTQLMFLKTQRNKDDFDVEQFLYEVFNDTDVSNILNDDLLDIEIDLALHQNKEEKEAEKQIDSFFKKKEKEEQKGDKVSNDDKIKAFFSKSKTNTPQQEKINNFFNKK